MHWRGWRFQLRVLKARRWGNATHSYTHVQVKHVGRPVLLEGAPRHTRYRTRKLALEDILGSLSTHQMFRSASIAKNTHGSYGGCSPCQWPTGSSCKQPLIDSQVGPPVSSSGVTEDQFVSHTMLTHKTADAFQRHEARPILRLARRARLRQQRTCSARGVMYFGRSARSVSRRGFCQGSARVVALDPHSPTPPSPTPSPPPPPRAG